MKKLTLLVIVTIFWSCAENEADAPAMFNVNSVSVETQDFQGSTSHNIKDLWMFLDGVDLGVFQLPANIPVIDEENVSTGILQFSPGVRNNGINKSPIIYPFYDSFILEKDITKGNVEEIDLVFNYGSAVKFALVSDFESGNDFGYDADEDGNLGIVASSTDVFEGSKSGLIALDEDNLFTEIGTSLSFENLPSNGSPVFMELDYKNDVDLNVGLIGFLGNTPIKNYNLVLNPSEEWNKVYVDFSFVIQESQLDSYKILLGAGIDAGGEPANVFIDNVKLVHF